MTLHYIEDRSYDDMSWRKIDLGRLDLGTGGDVRYVPIFDGSDGIVDNTGALGGSSPPSSNTALQ